MIKERVPFDPSLRQDVIGPKGANLKACKDATGVLLIDVDRKAAFTTVVGADYQVAEAKKFLGLSKGTVQVDAALQVRLTRLAAAAAFPLLVPQLMLVGGGAGRAGTDVVHE